MTSIALNPSAPSFIPSHRNTVPSVPLFIGPDQNPNPYLSYYLSPFYLQIPPQYVSYQYFSFPSHCATFQLISPPCAPALPPSVPRCSIKELDENQGPEISSADHEMVEPKPMAKSSVVNCRRTRSRMSELTVTCAPRCQEVRRRSSVKVSHRQHKICEDADFEMGSKTTLMIKNIPAKFRKGSLLAILRNHCIEENKKARALEGDEAVLSEFDFLYLPIDFRTNNNFGYAFVNFTSPVGARRLFKSLHNHHWIFAESNKVCQLNFARIQGLVESIEHADRMVFNRACRTCFFLCILSRLITGSTSPLNTYMVRK